jgi:LuxR family maltose regulon positive regulatory protein
MTNALDAIQQAEQVAQKQSPYASWMVAVQARLWLVEGNLAAALHWAEKCELPLDNAFDYAQCPGEYATLVRVWLAQGKFQAALTLLERMHAVAESTGRTGRVIEILILQALAFYLQGDIERAFAPLARALSLAEPEGYVRVFVDEGEPMARLLRLTKTRGVALEYIDKMLAAFPDLQLPPSKKSKIVNQKSEIVEPFTERELEVLRLLATGLSNQEIAQELVVATGTVKKHVHNIFGKLNVRNRSQAILRAEALHLLK